MRKIVTVVALFGLISTSFAQNEKETLNWLNSNMNLLDHVNCPTIKLYGDQLEFNDNAVRLFDDQSSCEIKWSDVTDVTKKGVFFYVKTNKTIDNNPLVLKFYIKDVSTSEKFVKALQNMANIKSNEFVKNDLF